MMPKSVKRFSKDIMLPSKSMMPKSVKRFSEDIMLHLLDLEQFQEKCERLGSATSP